jgi:hypothetical protein
VHPSYWGDPNDLIGACYHWNETNCVGTAKGLFHIHLSSLGKVPFPDQWKRDHLLFFPNTTSRMPNPVFLYESQQLSDVNQSRARQFREDVRRVLGLDGELPAIPQSKPDFGHFNPRQQARKDRHKIDICQDLYLPVRTALMKISREASPWIRTSFVSSPDVVVSSPDYFDDLLLGWMDDPCDHRKQSGLSVDT